MKRGIPFIWMLLACAGSSLVAQGSGNFEVNSALSQVVSDVRSAKTPADLDSILTKLAQLGWGTADNARARANLQEATDFVRQWQDYLFDVQNGRAESARQALIVIARSDSAVRFVARSHVLELLNLAEVSPEQPSTEVAVEKIIRGIKTPDDLGSALDQLAKLKQGSQALGKFGRADPATAIETLSPLEKAYRDLKAGLAVRIEILLASSDLYPPFQGIIAPVRADLVNLALPRSLGLPEGEMAKPGEGPYQFLDRLALAAAQRGDYLQAAKARETQQLLRDGSAYQGPERSQAGLFVTAYHFEAVGQYAAAVANYEKALASSDDLIPPKLIGERLGAIESAHPTEFRLGMEDYLSPTAPGDASPPAVAGAFGVIHPALTLPAATLSQPQTSSSSQR